MYKMKRPSSWKAQSYFPNNKRMAHFSVASLTQVVLVLVLICWTSSSTGAAFSLEEEFLQLKEIIIYQNLFSRDASVITVRFNL